MAYCHVLNAAKICLQAVNKGPMAALFEMWPKKGLFYVIIGHVVIQKNNNNKRKKKRRRVVLVGSPVLCVCVCVFFFFFFFPVFYYYYDTLNLSLCQNAWSREIGWR